MERAVAIVARSPRRIRHQAAAAAAAFPRGPYKEKGRRLSTGSQKDEESIPSGFIMQSLISQKYDMGTKAS